MAETLEFHPAATAGHLLAEPVREAIAALPPGPRDSVLVAEIDPASAGGVEFCDRYGFDYDEGANCVLVEGSRAGRSVRAACVIRPGTRTDLNGFVRRHLGMRRVTLIPREVAVEATGMEYGSMTAIGLPDDWRVLVDSRIAAAPRVVVGSGRVRSKLCLPGEVLLGLSRGESLVGLAVG
ncbi:YbaK/EbsC family protein [Saccharothrix syringae]|uniref:YbaK/aminoacyl-tRNA synthetase-associated domain-containing protein n=1 Tax=Saccharothrix syringae TaxID=103733 RepID=A0A5Q0GTX4_SACSY|nr:YbaK/EbsC family protein [Saccharothrix syringae]QFZ17383.1 hypothetical protein EKG83_07765 [Saccharothrix syringae]